MSKKYLDPGSDGPDENFLKIPEFLLKDLQEYEISLLPEEMQELLRKAKEPYQPEPKPKTNRYSFLCDYLKSPDEEQIEALSAIAMKIDWNKVLKYEQ